MKTFSKTEAKKQIQEFFKNIKNKTPRLSQVRSSSSESQAKEIKKIKKLAMKYNLPLKEKRKLFCKKCFTPYINPKIRIKNKKKIITCKECGYISRWKIK